jgi:predicted butyrate kinase (DUF1464 family)
VFNLFHRAKTKSLSFTHYVVPAGLKSEPHYILSIGERYKKCLFTQGADFRVGVSVSVLFEHLFHVFRAMYYDCVVKLCGH